MITYFNYQPEIELVLVFSQVSRPIRLILDRWIYEGELDDLYNEVSPPNSPEIIKKAHSCSSFITELILICKYLRILDQTIFVSTNSVSLFINVLLNTFVVINNYLLTNIVNEKRYGRQFVFFFCACVVVVVVFPYFAILNFKQNVH